MKLLKSEKAEAELVGHIIILGITVIGISMIALYGVPAIYSLQDMANVKSVEQAFTVLDSRASRAILGDSPLQITNINLGGGTLTVENSTGTSYMVIKSKNDTFNVTIPMGKIKYQLGDRIVAYEGGGVWSKYPTGGSVMLSPPEFHYNGVTLTLPVINVGGNTSVGGKGTATVSIKKKATVVQYPNSSFANRTNPVNSSEAGKVYVNITSDYYDAWADYAESLGYTIVSTNSTTRTTSIELTVVPSTLGSSTSITDPITIRGLNTSDDTPLENFSFRFEARDSNGLSSLNWQLTATSGTKKLIFHLSGASDDKADLNIGYEDTSVDDDEYVETWKGEDLFQVVGSGASAYVDVDLLNRSINLTYDGVNVGTTNGDCTKILQTKFNNTAFSWTDRTVNSSTNYNKQRLYNITQHYLQIFAPDIQLGKCNPGGNDPVAGDSTLLINYNTTSALTYMHITENRADVGIS